MSMKEYVLNPLTNYLITVVLFWIRTRIDSPVYKKRLHLIQDWNNNDGSFNTL